MAYIIENASILKNQKLVETSLLINNEKITAVRPSFKNLNWMKMSASPYIMTPPHIILDSKIPFFEPFSTLKQYFIENLIKQGCTTFLTYVHIDKEYILEESLKKLKMNLLNSPIDFIIGLKIPARLLTPSLLRKCKKLKIPVIFVEVSEMDELYSLPWGWIRESLFPYNSPLVPIFRNMGDSECKRAKIGWKEVIKTEKITAIEDEIIEGVPLHFKILRKIGIYPLKANLDQGGEVSYNFYLKSREIKKMEEFELFSFHQDKLVVTVHKGTVIRFLEKVIFRPGFGEQVLIKTPSFFCE